MHQILVRRSLQALANPIVAVAALVLGFNALLAQRLWPSWWTGKIGDGAWLIVAPLLATLVVGLIAPKRWDASRLGAVVIAMTGLAFALIKAVPLANAWAIDAFRLIGIEPKLALDPTDLLALPALLLTEWIWLGRRASTRPPSRLLRASGVVLAAAALIADSPAPQQLGVVCLEERDDMIVAYSQEEKSAYFQGNQQILSQLYTSTDGGETWSASAPTEADRSRELACSQTAWPIVIDDTTRLFFVSGQGIYASTDEGQTLTLEQPLANTVSVWVDDTTGRVIVAAGFEGLFVRSKNGEWAQVVEAVR